MEIPTTLNDLAGILQLRKLASPYNLLLTSTVSLTPKVLENMCGSNSWKDFCNWLQKFGLEDRINRLEYYLSKPADPEGYRSLAKLINAGYFSTVLTTNIDSFLEEALFECGVKPTSYPLLVVNRDMDEYIASTLESEPKGIRIVKLRGSLSTRTIPETFPEIFDLRKALREGVERYLNRDIIIFGSIERENDLHQLLSTDAKRSIYYIIPEEPSYNDVVVRAIRGRRITSTATSVITGFYGQFGAFLTALESELLPGQSTTTSVEASATSISSLTKQPMKLPESKPPKEIILASPLFINLPAPGGAVEKESQSVSPPANFPQQAQQMHVTTNDLQSSVLSGEQYKKKELQSYVSRIATLFIFIGGLGLIFLIISIFQKSNPSFKPENIIFLLIIAGAIVLGIVGVITSEQLANILSLGASGKPTKDKGEKKEGE
jgi:hypothetical protein